MSSAVNRPTDVKAKQADVDRKLQFYGILTAFQNGKVPSNEQIDIALNSFLSSRSLAKPSYKLSSDGKVLVQDARNVVEQAKLLLLSKNEGDLLQDFIWQAQKVDGANAGLPGPPVDKETAKQHGNQALEGLRTLGTLMVTNGQFRKLLNDAAILIRDVAGDAAAKAATKVNPSDEQLAQIDKPADDNIWHDIPNFSAGNLKQRIKSTISKKTPVDKDDLHDAAGNAAENARPSGSGDPADGAALAQKDQQRGTSSGVDAPSGAKAGVATLRKRANQNIPDETKEKARAQRERAKKYLSGKMPEERRDQTIWRLRKMVTEIQGHPDYRQATDTLLTLAETYGGHANTVGQQSAGSIKDAHADTSLKKAETDLKLLIERFANGTSTNDLFDSINTIYRDADKDPELKSWFKNIDAYVRKCLQQQGYIMEDAATNEWNALYDRGNFLLRNRYRDHTDRIVDEAKFIAGQFDEDPQNKRFAESVQKLFDDLGHDENGKPTFKPHLIKDLTEVIIPAVFENIRYVPIPRIEYSDPSFDAVIENLVIEGDNLMPNILEIANDHHFRWGRKKIASKNRHSIMLSVSGIQMDLRDVGYYVKRKKGTLKITDQGVADIFLGGTGLSFKIKMSTADKSDRQNFFKVDKVDVDVKNFNIRLKQSRYKLLFGVAKPLMLKVLRPALQKALQKQIKDQVHQLDTFLYRIKQEADRAQEEALENPGEAQNIYQRYVNAAQRKFMQRKRKAEEVAKNAKVNMAITENDSIFPDIHLPGGISSKATEYKNMAAEGNDWRSPVFKLGTAPTSSNIPAATHITRRDHSVTGGGLQNIGNAGSVADKPRDPAAQAAGPTNGSAANGFSNQVDNAFNNTTGKTNGKKPVLVGH